MKAAVELLNRNGPRGMTFVHVAAKLHVVPTSIAYYFRRKEDLAVTCYLESIRRLDESVERALHQDRASLGLRAFIADFFEERRKVAVGEADETAAFQHIRSVHDESMTSAYVAFFRRVRSIFAAPDAGIFGRPDQNARTHILLSQLHWARLWLTQYNPEDYGRIAERLSDILERGLAAAGSVWKDRPHFSSTPPRNSEDDVSRDAFLRAATVLINEEGYLGVSVQQISAQLGVTKGSFYHHNQAKDDLVVQCFERTWEIMRKSQALADAQTDTGFDNLAAFALHLVREQISGQDILIRTSALSAASFEMRSKLLAGFDRISSRVSSVVSDGIADGSIRPVDAQVASLFMVTAINSAPELHFWVPDVDAQNVDEIYLKPLFYGLFSKSAHCVPHPVDKLVT